MKYHLIVSDYDGTLGAAPANDIPKETLKAINEYVKKGGIFVVCTGREYRSIKRICINQGLKGLVACYQGAKIFDMESDSCLFDGGMDEQMALTALSAVEGSGLEPITYQPQDFYISKRTQATDTYERLVGIKAKVMDAKESVKKFGKTCKLAWLGNPEVISRLAKELNAKYLDSGIQFNTAIPYLLEAVNIKHNKGNAVRFLADYYKIPLDRVMAVGDSANDIDLITGGSWRDVADEITVPFNQEPIKHLIEKYCL